MTPPTTTNKSKPSAQLRERKSIKNYKEPATPPLSPQLTSSGGMKAEVSLSDPSPQTDWVTLFEDKMRQQFQEMNQIQLLKL